MSKSEFSTVDVEAMCDDLTRVHNCLERQDYSESEERCEAIRRGIAMLRSLDDATTWKHKADALQIQVDGYQASRDYAIELLVRALRSEPHKEVRALEYYAKETSELIEKMRRALNWYAEI